MKNKRIWIIIAIFAAIIGLFIFSVEIQSLINALKSVDFSILGLGALIMTPSLMLISIRWQFLLDKRVMFSEAFQADAISYMVRMFTPIYVPVLRVATLASTTSITISQATPGMLAERLLETIMRLIMLSLAAILISSSQVFSGWNILWILFIVGLFVVIIRFSNRAGEYMPRISDYLSRIPRVNEEKMQGTLDNLEEGISTVGTTRRLLTALSYSILMWSGFLVSFAIILNAAQIELKLLDALAVSAAVLVVLPPSTPAMIFVYQGLLVTLLLPFKVAEASNLLVYAILIFSVQMIFWLLTGIWGLKNTKLKVRDVIKLPGVNTEDLTSDDAQQAL
jgi:uncharacterized protein (TIRG00374 family)